MHKTRIDKNGQIKYKFLNQEIIRKSRKAKKERIEAKCEDEEKLKLGETN